MEKVVDSANGYGKDCLGCKRFGSDIMVSMREDGAGFTIHDFFLTNEQAERLIKDLEISLKNNRGEDSE